MHIYVLDMIIEQEFRIYIANITNCEDLLKVNLDMVHKIFSYLLQDQDLFRTMVDSLREWFDSACEDYCNGHNNLYTPQLTCLDSNMGIISSVVHNERENSAQMLIDLAIADVQARNPPVVNLTHGWMLRLNQTSPDQMQSEQMQSSSSIRTKSQKVVIGVSVGVAFAAVILILIIVGTVFGIHKRFASSYVAIGN